MVVGLNYRTAPVAVRERFWISKERRPEVRAELSKAEGIEEAIVIATCNRTEFWLWADDVTLAENSVMRLLGAEFGLLLCEWKHFYRLLDEAALLHIFRVASSLDSKLVGESQVVSQVRDAWQQAQKVGTTGRYLDAVLEKALSVSDRVHRETAIGNAAGSIPYAAVALASEVLGTLESKKVLLLGAGKMSELAARELLKQGVRSARISVVAISRTLAHAAELAAKLGGAAFPFEERWPHLAEADIIISSTSAPQTILSREEAESVVRERRAQGRNDKPLVIVDIAMPRDIDSGVREVKGIFLYDLDDLDSVTDKNTSEREGAVRNAQKIVHDEARAFRHQPLAERVVPTIAAFRLRLDEICRQELDSFRQQNGPFTRDQDEMLKAVVSRMTERIAGSLSRELKELPENMQQEQMTTALRQLFHLRIGDKVIAGGTRA
jgi:glutamyl-tRNA reductase